MGDGADQGGMALVHHPLEFARTERKLDPELGTERQSVPPQRSYGDVLDSPAFDERDDVLAEPCPRSNIGLAPPESVAEDAEASTKAHVIHRWIVTSGTQRRLT